MNVLFYLGRIAFAAIFVLSGATKLLDIEGTAQIIQSKVILPAVLADLAAQLESATRMKTPELLAILSGVVEFGGGLMVALNAGARFGAVLLLLFTAATIFYFHDFWNMAGEARQGNMIHALKNLSMIGALLVFFVLGPWRPSVRPAYE